MNPKPINDETPRDRPILLWVPRPQTEMKGGWYIGRWDVQSYNKRPRPFWNWNPNRTATAQETAPTHWAELPESP